MVSEDFIESIEALSWSERSDGKERTVSEDSDTRLWTEEALRLVRELYLAGATEVLAQDVTGEDDFEDASGLMVMLPKDLKARAALFAIEARALRDEHSL